MNNELQTNDRNFWLNGDPFVRLGWLKNSMTTNLYTFSRKKGSS